jgi:predicted esterase
LWAGAFPHDIPVNKLKTLFKRGKTFAVYGTRDPFLNESQAQIIQGIPAEFENTVSLFTFDGGHIMDAETLLKIHNK